MAGEIWSFLETAQDSGTPFARTRQKKVPYGMNRRKKDTSSKTLLLVSGDGELKRQITGILGFAGLLCPALTTVTYGQDALKVLARERPRLVILDDDLPDTTGLDFLRTLHQDGIETLVVYMATHHTLELEKEVRQLGVLYYTEKPPDLSVIKRIVTVAFPPTEKEARL